MQEFTFRHQQTIEGVPFVLLVFVVPFLILLAGIFLTFVPWIFWVAIPVAISIAIGGFQYFKRKAKAVDCIQVDDLGFTSENFGRVQYSDIDIYSIQPHSPYYKPPHSLYFKLHDGKEYLWILDGKKADIEEDVTTFYAFRKILLKHLMQQETAHTPLVGGSDIQQNHETITPPVAKKGKKWNYKQAYIPLSLVVVLGGVTRTCGEKYFEQKRQEEMTFFRRAVLSVEQDYQNTLEKSRHTAREYAKEAFGTTMLLTNDPDMKLSYVPDTRINKYSSISTSCTVYWRGK